MSKRHRDIERTLAEGLSHILRRTIQVNQGDQLAIAQEYKEWINCVNDSDFSNQEILVIDKYKLIRFL